MKHKITELTGALLDAAVAECGEWKTAHELFPTMTLDPTFKGWRIATFSDGSSCCMLDPHNPFRQDPQRYSPSTDWAIGGPIIERERIDIDPPQDHEVGALDGWSAICLSAPDDGHRAWKCGPTPLIAAMRAYVACKHGGVEEIELP